MSTENPITPAKTNDPIGTAADTNPKDLDPKTSADALDWFLSDEDQSIQPVTLPINVAPAGQKERVVDFGIRVLDRDEIQKIRKEATRTNGNEQTLDEMEVNLRLAVATLVVPDLSDRNIRTIKGQFYADPADALSRRFAHKPGIIDQIAGEALSISGYNDTDVKEIRAAKN